MKPAGSSSSHSWKATACKIRQGVWRIRHRKN